MPIPTSTPINILADPYLALGAIGKVVTAGLTWGIALLILLAFLYLFLGGFYILTAGDDPKKMAKGRQTILWAVIGLVLGASVYAIVSTISEIVPGGLPGIRKVSCQGTPVASSFRCFSTSQSAGACMASTVATCPPGQQGSAKIISCRDCSTPGLCTSCAAGQYECVTQEYCQ